MRTARWARLAFAAALVAVVMSGALRAQAAPAAPPTQTAVVTQTTAGADLPKTSSRLPLVLLVGTLAALVGFGVHLSRERT